MRATPGPGCRRGTARGVRQRASGAGRTRFPGVCHSRSRAGTMTTRPAASNAAGAEMSSASSSGSASSAKAPSTANTIRAPPPMITDTSRAGRSDSGTRGDRTGERIEQQRDEDRQLHQVTHVVSALGPAGRAARAPLAAPRDSRSATLTSCPLLALRAGPLGPRSLLRGIPAPRRSLRSPRAGMRGRAGPRSRAAGHPYGSRRR